VLDVFKLFKECLELLDDCRELMEESERERKLLRDAIESRKEVNE
jgi:hypothetical protein